MISRTALTQLADADELGDNDEKVAEVLEEDPHLLESATREGQNLAHIAVARGAAAVLNVICHKAPNLLFESDILGGLPEHEDGPKEVRQMARETRLELCKLEDQAEAMFSI